jgi:hypothetical protein
MVCKDKLWVENIPDLFCSFNIIPTEGMSTEAKLNAISRLVLLMALIIGFSDKTLAISVVAIAFVFILVFYYSSNHKAEGFVQNHTNFSGTHQPHTRENYIDFSGTHQPQPQTRENYIDFSGLSNPKGSRVPGLRPGEGPIRFCNDAVPIMVNEPSTSINQRLVGSANPKTKIAPIIAPRSHDLDVWRETDLVNHSAVNRSSNFDAQNSGYNCASIGPCKSTPKRMSQHVPQFFGGMHLEHVEPDIRLKKRASALPQMGSENVLKVEGKPQRFVSKIQRENYTDRDGIMQGYPPEYKNQILTQTLQPGVFQKSTVGEPVSSNIGISYQPQYLPTFVEQNKAGDEILYLQTEDIEEMGDIRVIENFDQTQDNVFDPRFSGYGASDRCYIEPVTSQPRFFYDDVNAITMPNYVTRSNVDVFPWADTYGPDVPRSMEETRQLAQNAFLDSTMVQRTELQERLMRKNNAMAWQQRVMPISRNGQRMMGSSMRA